MTCIRSLILVSKADKELIQLNSKKWMRKFPVTLYLLYLVFSERDCPAQRISGGTRETTICTCRWWDRGEPMIRWVIWTLIRAWAPRVTMDNLSCPKALQWKDWLLLKWDMWGFFPHIVNGRMMELWASKRANPSWVNTLWDQWTQHKLMPHLKSTTHPWEEHLKHNSINRI